VPPGSGACAACLAAGHCEHARLARIAGSRGQHQSDTSLLLCADHLSDLIILAGRAATPPLLAWQASSLAAVLPRPGQSRGRPTGWLRFRHGGAGPGPCPVCLDAATAAQRAIDDLRARLRGGPSDADHRVPLCVRHLLSLKAADPWAGQMTATGAIDCADLLIAELDRAFTNSTCAHRHEAKGPEMTAWRRAAAFLDGGVFCGCPPRPT